MKDIAQWLEERGLGNHATVLVENEIGLNVLPELTEEDLRELGLPMGPRKLLLKLARELDASDLHENDPSPSERPAGDAERRQLTVMFADLVGSTELSRALDPEDLRIVNLSYQDTAKAAVERFGGYIARYMGDGVLAYFGYPSAHEDAPERAVLAGLQLLDAVSTLEGTPRLSVRVGIATGPVVVGDLIGEGASQESAVVGETPNLAARLQSSAEPGELLISAVTFRVVEGAFEIEELKGREFKGFAERVPAYRVVRAVSGPSRFAETRARSLSPLVGRSDELALLTRRWEQACDGESRFVFISGDAGLGKSRLVEELFLSSPDIRRTAVRCQCSPHQQNTPFYPIARYLERAAQLNENDTPEDKREKLNRMMIEGGGTNEAAAPLAALLSLPANELDELIPRQKREAILAALVSEVVRISRVTPRLLVVEDVHWADASTIEMLERLMDETRDSQLLVVITHRPEFRVSWSGQGANTQLFLSRLGRRETRTLLQTVSGVQNLGDDLIDEIASRSDGVPLYVEELAKGALDRLSSVIPATLYDALLARLDRLGLAKEIAQTAACIGREFSFELLAKLATVPEAQLSRSLDELTHADVIHPTHRQGRASYAFKHALVRDAAYESLLLAKRKELHVAIAAALESLQETSAPPHAQLGYHYGAGGQPELACSHFEKAGNTAFAAFSIPEALALYDHGISVLGDEGSVAEMELRLKKASAYLAISDFDKAWEESRRVAQSATRVGDTAHEGQAMASMAQSSLFGNELERCESECAYALELSEQVPDGDAVAASAWLWRSLCFAVRGELETVQAGISTALNHCRVAQDLTSESMIIATSGVVSNWQGDFDRAIALSTQGTAIARTVDAHLPLVMGLFMSALPLVGRGRYDDAYAVLTEGIPLAERVGEEFQYMRMLNTMGWLFAEVGGVEEAIRYNEQSDAAATRRGLSEPTSNCRLNIADIALLTGDVALARELCEDVHGIVHKPSTGDWMKWRYAMHMFAGYAEVLLNSGQVEAARDKCNQCLEIAVKTGSKKYLVRAWRLNAQIAAAHTHWNEAAVAIQKALDYAVALGNPTQYWKTQLALGEICRQRGQMDESRCAYREAGRSIDAIGAGLRTAELQNLFGNSPVFRTVREEISSGSNAG